MRNKTRMEINALLALMLIFFGIIIGYISGHHAGIEKQVCVEIVE